MSSTIKTVFLAVLALVTLALPAAAADRVAAIVVDIYDGDTITVMYESGETAKIRMIGIDTPELKDNPHGSASIYAPIARDYLDALLMGRKVNIEYDVTPKDKYERTLAYIYLPDGLLINEQMLIAGYAELLNIPPNSKYAERFTVAQSDAVKNNKGLWGLGVAFAAAGGTVPAIGTGTAPAPLSITPPTTRIPLAPADMTSPAEGGGFFVTKSGKKYHVAGCRYLTASAVEISEDDAKARGYTPCSVWIGAGAGAPGGPTGTATKIKTSTSTSSSSSSDGRCEATTKKGTR